MGAASSVADFAHDHCAALVPEETIEALQQLAHRGFRLFPCKYRGKTPLLQQSWQTIASSNLSTVLTWARQTPRCNWGVATGRGSRVFVLDVDGESGRKTLAALERIHGPLPPTLTSRTGRSDGGEHRWFRYPADREIRNSAGRLGDGLDVRGAGGYVIAPPSTHETGRIYGWVDHRESIADAPGWLLDLVSAPASMDDDQLMRDTVERRVPTSREAPPPRFDVLVKGGRNDGLFRHACALRRKGFTRGQIELEVLSANTRRCIPPLPKNEVLTIAETAASYPVGGPDPLESAWAAVVEEKHARGYPQFIALARNLQRARPRFSIALPEKRIGELMGVHATQVSRWRRRATRDGLLYLAEEDIPHRKAASFFFKDVDEELSH